MVDNTKESFQLQDLRYLRLSPDLGKCAGCQYWRLQGCNNTLITTENDVEMSGK